MSSTKLSPKMRELLWALLQHQKKPVGVLVIEDDRTAQALVRRGLLSLGPGGYSIDEKAARKALAMKS